METLCIILLAFLALEGLIIASMPELVKKLIAEVPRGWLIVCGMIEAGVAISLFAMLLSGKF